ncbi:MAG: VanZ family protein [Thermoleophilaceae bacterium]|nr:VanZ family protein [Thermoleophilaceae bacterium]
MTLTARTIALWLPPLVLMGVIFALSAQPNLNSGLGVADLIGRKLVHASEYALLTFLWWRALVTTSLRTIAPLVAFSLAIGYAGTDEFHQTFVTGRHGTPVDVLIDASGAALCALYLHRRRRR